MRPRTIYILLIFVVFTTNAQYLAEREFQIGGLSLAIPFDSISASLGIPDSIVKSAGYWDEFTAHYFPNLVIWVSHIDRRIWTIDIYDSAFVSYRGIKVGDPISTVDSLYEIPDFRIEQREFERLGPYDSTFRNYNEWRYMEYLSPNSSEGWLFVFFSNHGVVTKLLTYIGVH